MTKHTWVSGALWLAVLVMGCASRNETKRLEPTSSVVRIEIDEPTDGAVRAPGLQRVSGRVVGLTTGSVVIDGTEVPVADGQFQATLNVLDSGTRQIQVSHPESGQQASVTLHVDGKFPTIRVVTPSTIKNQVAPNDQFAVVVDARDEHELASVTLNGATLTADGEHQYRGTVTLAAGINRLRIEATDVAGNRTRKVLLVPYGETVDPAAHQHDAIHVILGRRALETVGRSVAAMVDRLPLDQLLKDTKPLASFGSIEVNVLGFKTFGPYAVGLKPHSGGLTLDVAVPAFKLIVAAGQTEVQLTADGLDVTVPLTLSSDSDGALQTALGTVAIVPKNLVLQLSNSTLLSPESSLYQQMIGALNALVNNQLATRFAGLARSALATLSKARTVELLGQSLVLSTSIDGIRATENSIALSLGLGASLKLPDGVTLPPLLDWSAPLETLPDSEQLAVVIDETTLNRLLYLAWGGGLLDVRLDQALLDRNKTEIQLVAGFLGDYLEGLSQPVHPETPIALSLHPSLPPVFDLALRDGAQLGLVLPTVELLITTDLGTTRELVRGDLAVELALGMRWEGDAVGLALEQFAIDLNLGRDDATNPGLFEAFTDTIFGPAKGIAAGMLHQLVLPNWQGVRVDGLKLSRVGSDGRHLMVEVSSQFAGGEQ